jgi:hypothetical protein
MRQALARGDQSEEFSDSETNVRKNHHFAVEISRDGMYDIQYGVVTVARKL